jgi:hypothetical protein
MHVHLTLFVFFFSLALIYALSLFGGIYRRRVMTRKERGEDVYGCMLGQTLNMMKAVRRVIQSTVLKKEKKSMEKDATVMAFFMSCKKLAKSTQWMNNVHILAKKMLRNINYFS